MMKNLMVRFWLVLVMFGHLPIAKAQMALQPIYTRPLKGEPVTVFDDLDVEALGFGTVYSSMFDWRGFSGVQVVVSSSSGRDCKYVPKIIVGGSSTPSSPPTTSQPSPNAEITIRDDTSFAYEVNVVSSYIRIGVSRIVAEGVTTCTFDINIIPLPYSPFPINTSWGMRAYGLNQNYFNVVTITTAATIVGHPTADTTTSITVQNQSTSVVFCAPTNQVTTSSYGVVLSAAASAADGTGGSWTWRGRGPVYCVVASGTAKVSYVHE